MRSLGLDSKVRLVAIVAASIFCLLIVHSETSVKPPRVRKYLSKGTKLTPPMGYKWASDKPTLVLVLKVGCPHCESEMPFYQQLVKLERMNKIQSHLVAFYPDPRTDIELANFGRLQGLDILSDIDMRSLPVEGTPTLFLVDGLGIVKSVWIGELGVDTEQSVISTISTSASAGVRDGR